MKSIVTRIGVVLVLFLSEDAFAGRVQRFSERKVKDVYIVDVKIKDGATIRRVAQEVAAKYKGRVIDVYTEVLGGFAIELPASAVVAVSELPEVDVVYESPIGLVTEAPVERAATTRNWGLDRIDQRALPMDGWYYSYYRGSDVFVYIVDSGVDEVGDLAGRISEHKSFVGTGTQDCFTPNGHGTQVASTVGGSIYGVARGAKLVNVRTACGTSDSGPDRLISALNWIAQRHNANPGSLSVVNISLEYASHDGIDAAVRDAVAAGIVVVVGAGNNGRSACTRSPQRTGNPAFIRNNPDGYSAITVAASDRNDRVSFFGIAPDGQTFASNTGQCVDVFAPGGPGLVAQGYNSVDENWQGTSAAAPFVSGLAALTLARFGNITPGMVETYIRENSTKNIIRDNPDAPAMLSSTPNNLVYQILPGKRRACCS